VVEYLINPKLYKETQVGRSTNSCQKFPDRLATTQLAAVNRRPRSMSKRAGLQRQNWCQEGRTVKSFGHSRRRPKQTAGFGCESGRCKKPRRCRCCGFDSCLSITSRFSTPALCTFSHLCPPSSCAPARIVLFEKARVARPFCFLLLCRSIPTNGRCFRVIVELTVAFLTARPTS
jgi:hypothetical protein